MFARAAAALFGAYVSIRQHTWAYVSIRQHTWEPVSYVCHSCRRAVCCIRQHTSAYVSIRQHTSAYVSIRQHTSGPVNNVCKSCSRAVCFQKSQWLKCTKAKADTGGWSLWVSRRNFEILKFWNIACVLASHWYFRFRNRGAAPTSARHHLFPFSQ